MAVKLLLQSGADPDVVQARVPSSPLAEALYKQSAKKPRMLLKAGARLDIEFEHGKSILHKAISSSPEIMKIILKFRRFLDVESRDHNGSTALMAFGRESNLDCIRFYFGPWLITTQWTRAITRL